MLKKKFLPRHKKLVSKANKRTVGYTNVCAFLLLFLFLGGCLRKKEVIEKNRIVTPDLVVDLPLPLVQGLVTDISLSNNYSILSFTSDFSLSYLKKFYAAELDQMGWLSMDMWIEQDSSHMLLFEQMHQRLMIRLREQKNDTLVTIYRTIRDEQNSEI